MSNHVLTIKQNYQYAVSMKLLRCICFIIVLLFTCTLVTGQDDFKIQKSMEALASDSLYELFTKEGFNPEKQLLDNTFSENFPYNIIINPGTFLEKDSQTEKKLIVVFPQQDAALFLEDCTEFINTIKNRTFSYALELVFTANDKNAVVAGNAESGYPSYIPAGTATYINSLETTENTAAIIVASADNNLFPALSIFDKIVEIIPGGVDSDGENLIVPMGFFKTITNGFEDSNSTYSIRGQFLSLYRLGMIASNPLVSIWLDSDISAVLLNVTPENSGNIFKTIDSVQNQYVDSELLNQDTNYTLIKLFSRTFFISEQVYIIFLILASAVILFGFYNFSFMKGAHKNIHRQEFLKTWYLIPLITLLTGFFLFVSQYLIQILIPTNYSLPLFSLIVKTTLAILLLALFSFIQYATKLPLTGFIYGYILSISAFINIFIFATIEITLVPIFILEYLIVYFSRRTRKIKFLILYVLIMLTPYIPFIISLRSFDHAFTIEFISHASFLINFLFACILLPFQIMTIRILIRLKLWGKHRSATKKRLYIQLAVVLIAITLLYFISLFVPRIILSTQIPPSALEQLHSESNKSLQIKTSQINRIGQTTSTLEISSAQQVLRYYIEISSNDPLPVFDANYPYDILSKPLTAVFELDEYPPEPFVLTFTTKEFQDTLCSITAWVKTDTGIQKEEVQNTIVGLSE